MLHPDRDPLQLAFCCARWALAHPRVSSYLNCPLAPSGLQEQERAEQMHLLTCVIITSLSLLLPAKRLKLVHCLCLLSSHPRCTCLV